MDNKIIFHEPVTVELGNETRTLMLTPEAWRRAQRALNGRNPYDAVRAGGMDPYFVVAAVALHHDPRTKNTSDKTVEGWITREPKSFVRLVAAVGETIRRFNVVLGLQEDEPKGEGEAPTTSP